MISRNIISSAAVGLIIADLEFQKRISDKKCLFFSSCRGHFEKDSETAFGMENSNCTVGRTNA